jgi:adenylate cyclase
VATERRPKPKAALRNGDPAEVRARLRRSELLLRITHEVSTITDLDTLLHTLVRIVARETDSERASLFLNDAETGELYTRVALGDLKREIRILNNAGIAGAVFHSGKGDLVHDAYADKRFDRKVDEQTGFATRSLATAPVKSARGEIIGVVQALNKKRGRFTEDDLELLGAMATQASMALQSTQFIETSKKTRQQEMEFLDLVSDITSSLELSVLLKRVIGEATKMLNAERSTLFLHDRKTRTLWSEVGEGLGKTQIRIPDTAGIAGAVFQSGQTINIPHAYADLRFNPAVDRSTGYFTRSLLCVPIVNKEGRTIGVTQTLNKKGGPFTDEDEARLKAFTAQVAIALENAALFEDVQNIKNYNQSILESMTNGVLTLDEDGKVHTCNAAGHRILRTTEAELLDRPASDVFTGENQWVMDRIAKAAETNKSDVLMGGQMTFGGEKVDSNLTIEPLISLKGKKLGLMVMIEDISNEKRLKSTMSRYVDPAIADQLLAKGGEVLGGTAVAATVLFSDIRSFTTLTEELGPQGTVSLLNDYFAGMVDCITEEGGILDKFIGDAIMAEFGIPVAHGDDPDRAMRAAIKMITRLDKHNAERKERGAKPINIGIGLATETIVAGNIGTAKRMDYTVIGDGVNLASRLEGANKEYGSRIIVAEGTWKALRGTYRAREIDRIVVKGKTEPIPIFEILDYHTATSFPNMPDVLAAFRDALAFYRSGEFDRAEALFRRCLELNPTDKTSQVLLERCEYLKAHADGKWDGIWVMKSK